MSHRRKTIATFVLIGAFVLGLSPATDAWASGSSEVQDLRREINQIRSDLQALQAAVTEATELERQRSAKLTKALSSASQPVAPAPAPAAPPAGSEAVAATNEPSPTPAPAASAASDDKDRRRSRKRRSKRSPRVPWKAPRSTAR